MTAVPEHARHALAAPIPQPAGSRHRQAARAGYGGSAVASSAAGTGRAGCVREAKRSRPRVP